VNDYAPSYAAPQSLLNGVPPTNMSAAQRGDYYGHSASLGNQQAYNSDVHSRYYPNNLYGQQTTRHANAHADMPLFSANPSQCRPTPVSQFGSSSGSNMDKHHLKAYDIPKYSGFGDKKTPYDFLADLERYMQISGIHPDSLLQRVIPTSLIDDAFFWYNMEMSWDPFENWEQFKLRFRQQFQPVDYERTLKREMDDRYQGPDESLSFFLRVIAGYYYRLGIQNDSRIIERVCEQMHPSYKRHIRDARLYQSLAHFKRAVEHADVCVQAEQKYKAPVPGKSIEPLLAYNPRTTSENKPITNNRREYQQSSFTRQFEQKKQVSFPHTHETITQTPTKEVIETNVKVPAVPTTVNTTTHENKGYQTTNERGARSRSPSPGRNFSGCFNCKGNHFARDCPLPNPNTTPQSPSPLNSNSLGPQRR